MKINYDSIILLIYVYNICIWMFSYRICRLVESESESESGFIAK